MRELVGLYKEMMSIETKMTSLDYAGGHANQVDVLYDRYGELIQRIEQYSKADQQKAQESEGYLKAEQKQLEDLAKIRDKIATDKQKEADKSVQQAQKEEQLYQKHIELAQKKADA